MAKGKFYEAKAAEFLKLKGYRIVETNFRTRWGEIDIIAEDKGCIALVEVKARRKRALVSAKQALDKYKQQRIITAAKIYSKHRPGVYYRFDMVAIEAGDSYRKYELIKGAFRIKG